VAFQMKYTNFIVHRLKLVVAAVAEP
jgi:hypothetical protein